MRKRRIPLLIYIIILVCLIISGFYIKKEIDNKEALRLQEIQKEEEERKQLEEERIKKGKEEALINAKTTFDKNVTDIAKQYGIIGMSVAIFEENEIIHTFNFGFADRENEILVNDNTKYRIASTSKLVSTIGLMRLYDQGLFKLDDYIKDITGINFDSEQGRITFKNLLTHTAGFDDDALVYTRATYGQIYDIDTVLENSHSKQYYGIYKYSNLGIGSIGAIIERFTDTNFGEYMRNLFLDLNIDAAYSNDLISDQESISKIYNEETKSVVDIQNWNYTSDHYNKYGLYNSYLQAHGDLIISAKDLAKFGILMANQGQLDDKQILKEETVELMLKGYIDNYDNEGNYWYTEGLSCHNFKTLLNDREIYGHTGNAYGAITALWFDPKTHTGIVILDNYAPAIKENNTNVFLKSVLEECYNDFFR